MNIIARKPRTAIGDSEWIVVDRGVNPHDLAHGRVDPGRFVSATANQHSLENGEWFWGHYFPTLKQAMDHFNGRSY